MESPKEEEPVKEGEEDVKGEKWVEKIVKGKEGEEKVKVKGKEMVKGNEGIERKTIMMIRIEKKAQAQNKKKIKKKNLRGITRRIQTTEKRIQIKIQETERMINLYP